MLKPGPLRTPPPTYFVVLHDVVDVLDEQLLGLDGVDDVRRPLGARVIQVRNLKGKGTQNTTGVEAGEHC